MDRLPKNMYVFLVYTYNRDLIGAFGSREDADAAAKNILIGEIGYQTNDPKDNCTGQLYWSWYSQNNEVFVESVKVQ